MTRDQIEKEAILRALDTANGSRGEASRILGISIRTLQRKMKTYEL